jgi:hypothetical protein
MAKPNYAYEKRQRELAKKRKKEEKALRKGQGRSDAPDEPAAEGAPAEEGAAPEPAAGETGAPPADAPRA